LPPENIRNAKTKIPARSKPLLRTLASWPACGTKSNSPPNKPGPGATPAWPASANHFCCPPTGRCGDDTTDPFMKTCRSIELLLAKLVIFVSISQFCFYCHADPLSSWSLVLSNSPVPITSMAYGNGTFVGYGGGIWLVSHDGTNWTIYATPPFIYQGGVAYGNGQFMAFGTNTQNKANYILQSTNGMNWTPIYTSSNILSAAAYGNNTWVFVWKNEIVTANETLGTNWNWSDYQPNFTPACITYANGVFAIGANFLNNYTFFSFFSSSDGITWQYNSSLPSLIQDNSFNYYYHWRYVSLEKIAFGNGVFVATAQYTYFADADKYNPRIFTSSDLVNWVSSFSQTNIYSESSIFRIVFGGNQFIASGFYNSIYSSMDGYTWVTNSHASHSGLNFG
jgi:hypothetical protein